MSPGEGTLTAHDGISLHWDHHPATVPLRGVILNICGLGDHSGLHPTITGTLPGLGFAVYALDTRGNGKSGGKAGHVRRWTDFREDLHRFTMFVRERETAPLTLLGHSLGGLMVLDYSLAHPGMVHRIVAAAPPLGSLGTPGWLVTLARVLSRVAPSITLQTGLDLSRLAHDPAVIAAVEADPLFHRRASGRLATEVLATRACIHQRAREFRDAVLVMHGDDDAMVSIDGSRRLVKEAGGRVTLLEYEGAWHALLADWGWQERMSDLVRWIDVS